MLAAAVEVVLGLVTVCGLVYTGLALLAARSFAHAVRKRQRAAGAREAARPAGGDNHLPGVSVLKPLKGADEELLEALRSHCVQGYAGPWEMLCGLRRMDDPAVHVVRRLQEEFPAVALRLVHCPEEMGTSGKVSTLVQLLPEARYEHLLINDSDIHVEPDYLASILREFRGPGVGMVTALYRGVARRDRRGRIPMGSRLEALGISTEFQPGVLTARMLERGIRFGLGSTLAMRRDALEAAGGLRPLLESLADDYEMGARIAAAGYRVELASEVVETSVPPYSVRGFFEHQMRWARSTRDSRRWGYLGLGVTFCVPWAMLTVVASGLALPSVALLVMALLARVSLALAVGVGILRDGQVLRDLLLLPVRDCLGLFFWMWSYAGDTVVWRGERFRLRRGKLLPMGEGRRVKL